MLTEFGCLPTFGEKESESLPDLSDFYLTKSFSTQSKPNFLPESLVCLQSLDAFIHLVRKSLRVCLIYQIFT